MPLSLHIVTAWHTCITAEDICALLLNANFVLIIVVCSLLCENVDATFVNYFHNVAKCCTDKLEVDAESLALNISSHISLKFVSFSVDIKRVLKM